MSFFSFYVTFIEIGALCGHVRLPDPERLGYEMSKKQTEELSKSKAKRQERQKEVSRAKRHKLIGKIVGIVVAVVIIAAIVAAIGLQIYKVATRTTTSSDFSAGLNEDGTIANIDVEQIHLLWQIMRIWSFQ